MIMTPDELEGILAALRKYDVQEFRHKEGDGFFEIVLSGGAITADEEKEEMEDVSSVYHSTNIGITKRGFDDDEEENIRQIHRNVIKDH
jgi:hypothetical protein